MALRKKEILLFNRESLAKFYWFFCNFWKNHQTICPNVVSMKWFHRYLLRISPIQKNIQNIKKFNVKSSCNYENISKLFFQKIYFIIDFILISNQFASLWKVCYWEENIRKKYHRLYAHRFYRFSCRYSYT